MSKEVSKSKVLTLPDIPRAQEKPNLSSILKDPGGQLKRQKILTVFEICSTREWTLGRETRKWEPQLYPELNGHLER